MSNHVSHRFAGRLAAEDVTAAEWVLMRTLYEEDPMPPSRIADEMGMTRGAITKLADRLIKKALIVRKADRSDGRAQTLGLTAKGKSLVPVLATLADQNDAEFFGHLKKEERRALERILRRMVESYQMNEVPTS